MKSLFEAAMNAQISKPVQVYLNNEQHARLAYCSYRFGLSKSAVLRELLMQVDLPRELPSDLFLAGRQQHAV